MQKSIKHFKSPPKKYQPKGLTILYEDHDILVIDKTSGLLTVGTEKVKENTVHYRLNSYVQKGNPKSKNRIHIVHRLGRDTSGVLLFAKNENAKRYLQEEWQNFKKTYYAVVRGIVSLKENVIISYLAENSIHRMYSVDNPENGKLAETGYKVLRESRTYSLLEVYLLTDRKNQIRVHLSEKGCPVAGDKIYGEKEKGIKRLALHSASLTIKHPYSKEAMTFETKLPTYFKTLMKI